MLQLVCPGNHEIEPLNGQVEAALFAPFMAPASLGWNSPGRNLVFQAYSTRYAHGSVTPSNVGDRAWRLCVSLALVFVVCSFRTPQSLSVRHALVCGEPRPRARHLHQQLVRAAAGVQPVALTDPRFPSFSFAQGSDQYAFVSNAFATTNRTQTPWLIVSACSLKPGTSCLALVLSPFISRLTHACAVWHAAVYEKCVALLPSISGVAASFLTSALAATTGLTRSWTASCQYTSRSSCSTAWTLWSWATVRRAMPTRRKSTRRVFLS